ncbi:MAG TPA: DNA polymerase III subunit delta [Candidatus Saccharimonadales bacterium]|nr:DNA polymerase III subunit delta [Candidatus Saccharimonadales bacterium]
MIVTLTGTNTFMLRQELKRLVAAFVTQYGDLSLERLDGEETDAARMREAASSLPFLTARKMVILREPGKQKAFAEAIEEVFGEVADTTDLILVEPKLDKRLSYYKTLKKQTDFHEYTELDAAGLARWATEYVHAEGGTLAAADAKLLIDRVGLNQQLITQELDKLLGYDLQITRASIELLTEQTPQSTVFELLDAAFSGKIKRAMELYREQRALKVEPQAIIAMLAWQLHILALVKAAGKRSAEDIARESKLNPYVVRKTQSLARHLTLTQLKRQIRDLLNLDVRLKTKAVDADEALQLYLLQVAYE